MNNGRNTSLSLLQMPLLTHPRSHLSLSRLSPAAMPSPARTPSSFSSSVIFSWWAPVKLGKAGGSARQRTAPTATFYLRLLRGRKRHKWVCNSCHSSCKSQPNPANAFHSHSLSDPTSRPSHKQQHILSTEYQLQEGSQWGKKDWENSSRVTPPQKNHP